MIQEFDKLNIYASEYEKMSKEEVKERVKKQDELLSKMSKEEIEELLKRPYTAQYKAKLKKFLK